MSFIPASDVPPSHPSEPTHPEGIFSPPPLRRWGVLLAWMFIVGVVVGILLLRWLPGEHTPAASQEEQPGVALVTFQLQMRYLVGVARLGVPGFPVEQFYQQARQFNQGSYAQRLRFAIIAGELAGPTEALKQLKKTERLRQQGAVKPSREAIEQARSLRTLYRAYRKDRAAAVVLSTNVFASPLTQPWSTAGMILQTESVMKSDQKKHPRKVLSGKVQEQLREQLDWFGKLALTPAWRSDPSDRAEVLGPARRTALVILGWAVFLIGVGLIGVLILVLLLAIWLIGHLHSRLPLGSAHSGVYVEAFALYMVLFWALLLLARWLPLGSYQLLWAGGAALFSLVVLGWPVLRGVPWKRVRLDIGWHSGQGTVREMLWGMGAYAMALPLAFIGVLAMLGLMRLQEFFSSGSGPTGPNQMPTHPIAGVLAQGDWWVFCQVLFLAAVIAPIVEETMFRGLLYFHLRDASRRLGVVVSVGFSLLCSGFIFAVIHPQGWVGVPVLAMLATGFALAREWRGSLWSAIIAHGINNAMVTLLVRFMLV